MNIKTYRPIFFQVISFLIPILSFGLLSNRLLINANQLYIQEFSLYLSLVSITSLLELGQQNALILSVSKTKKNDLRLEPYLITCLYNICLHFLFFFIVFLLISQNIIFANYELNIAKLLQICFSSELLFLISLDCSFFRGITKYKNSAFFISAPPLLISISTLLIIFFEFSPDLIIQNAFYILIICKLTSIFFLSRYLNNGFNFEYFKKLFIKPFSVINQTYSSNLSIFYISYYFTHSLLTTLWMQIPRIFLLGYSPLIASQFVLFQSIAGKFNGIGSSIGEISINNSIKNLQSKIISRASYFAKRYSTFIALFTSVIAALVILPKTTNFYQYSALFIMCTGAIISSTVAPIYFEFIAQKKMFLNTFIQGFSTFCLSIFVVFSYIIINIFNFIPIFLLICMSVFLSDIIHYLSYDKMKNYK